MNQRVLRSSYVLRSDVMNFDTTGNGEPNMEQVTATLDCFDDVRLRGKEQRLCLFRPHRNPMGQHFSKTVTPKE